jgi:hypothetical protein
MKAELAAQQFPGPEDLLTATQEFLSEIQWSGLELVVHHWIERVQWMLDDDGDYFHKQTFYDHHSVPVCTDRPAATTYPPPISYISLLSEFHQPRFTIFADARSDREITTGHLSG